MDNPLLNFINKATRPCVFAALGALFLSIFSIYQKKILGAPPFTPIGFIVPVLFGAVSGAFIGFLLQKIRSEHRRNFKALKQSTNKLQTSEELFRMLAENASDVIFRWNLEKRTYEYISPAVLKVTGYSFENFTNDPGLFTRIVFEEDRGIFTNLQDSSGNPKPFIEYRITHKKGKTVWINQRNAVSRNIAGKAVFLEGIATDITEFMLARQEKKLLYQQLNQSQKLESMGRLAGGVAHDFNNLLTVINGYANLVLESTAPEDPRYQEVQNIHTAGQKAAVLTSQLLAFSRDQMVEVRALDLNPVMQDLMTMLRRIIGSAITVEMKVDDSLPRVLIDPVHFDQIILNLVINARDAMMNSGHLCLTLAKAYMSGEQCDQCGEAIHGKYVRLSVSDTGRGISPDDVERIFDPFFTTKSSGKGTGLGLATVVDLVLKYKGHIQLETTRGVGSTFKILFPATANVSQQDIESEVSINTRDLFGTEKVLLVEDEGLIRNLTQTLLEQYGYQVRVAADGETAMEIFQKSSHSFDLLFTDIVMPGMDGRELYKQASALKPSLKVLFMSGFTDSIEENIHLLDIDLHFLGKPFNAREMALKVRNVLDNSFPG